MIHVIVRPIALPPDGGSPARYCWSSTAVMHALTAPVRALEEPHEREANERRGAPPVSVVIATRDRPVLLRRALEGVARQDYQGQVECIVVFDQSTPDPGLAVEEGPRTVQVVANTKHTPGLAGARNTGIDAATGEFVAFCDDDDEWLPAKLSRQVELAIQKGFTTVVTGVIVCFDDKETSRVPAQADVTLEELVRRRVMEAHPSTVLVDRRALVDRIGPVDEDIPGSFAEDYDWILRAVKAGPIGVVPQALVRVYWGQSMFSQRWLTIIEALDYLVAKHPEFNDSPEGLGRIPRPAGLRLCGIGKEVRGAVRGSCHTSPQP